MKKLFTVLAVVALTSTTAVAQNDAPVQKYSVGTNSFWSNWYLQGSFAYGTSSMGGNPWHFFSSKNNNAAFGVSLGKWVTPGLGLRAKYMGVDARYEDVKFRNNVWRVDGMFNLVNLFKGYNEARNWDVSVFTGFGGMGRKMQWDLGANLAYNLTNRVGVFVEASLMMGGRHGKWLNFYNGWEQRCFALEVGLTYNLGRTGWNKTPDVEAITILNRSQMDALNAELADLEAENAKLKSMLKKQSKQ